MNRILLALLPLALVAGFAIADGHTPVDPTSDVPGIDCELNWEGEQRTPAEMLMTLNDRDEGEASFVDESEKYFDSVGDLIQQKCTTPADSTE